MFFALVLWRATVMEDAYITFRVIDNFYQGYGLRWNIDERVQVYTHPLWMLAHLLGYALWKNIFLLTLLLSLGCTAMALVLPLRQIAAPDLARLCLFIVPLAASRSFVMYSTSGFENPLQHALFAWFGWVLWRARPERFWLWLSFSTALALVNRLDTMFIYVPLWGYLLCSRFRTVRWRQIALGALPIIGWELFSLFYYGFLFPNTKYAKLGTGFGEIAYLKMGLYYFLNLAVVEPTSILLLCFSVASLPWLARCYLRKRGDRWGLPLFLAAGIVAQMLYVVSVGGTYLTGRFLTLPIYASAWLVLFLLGNALRPCRMLTLACLQIALVIAWPAPAWLHARCGSICFNMVHYFPQEKTISLVSYAEGDITLPQPRSLAWYQNPVVAGSIGQWGFMLRRNVHIIDYIGLADPLMARLPIERNFLGGMGNLPRRVPTGYVHAVETGDTGQMDADLAAYYQKLRLIVSGDLWSADRLRGIIIFNLGGYDYLRQRYIAHIKTGPQS